MGEAILVLLGLGLTAYLLLAPAIALALASSAGNRRRELEERVADLERRLARAERREQDAMRIALTAPRLGLGERPAPIAPPVEEITPAPREQAPAPIESVLVPAPVPVPVPVPESAPAPVPVPEPTPSLPAAARSTSSGTGTGTGTGTGRDEPSADAQPATLEEQLGLTWLTRIGAAAFLLGALFFFKYAVDNAWIGPTGRVALGGVVGAALLAVAELIREKTKPRFVHALTGIGLATLFVTIWASAVFYELVPPVAALVANTVVLFLGTALALRHRGEAILVLCLLAGFLNPVVLSTGQDRPFELFTYLLLVTSVVHAAAARLRFRVAPILAVLGTAALFGGWYERYFDLSPPRSTGLDLPAESLSGAYFELSARATPLLFVALFAAQWIAVGLVARARAEAAEEAKDATLASAEHLHARAAAVAALVLAHAGAAVLIYDHTRLLAATAIALAGLSIVLFRRLEATNLLVLPMGAAFAAFLAVSGGVPEAERTTLVGLLGVWTAVYTLGFLRDLDRRSTLPGAAAIATAVGAGLFDGLAGALLVEVRPSLFVFLLALTSALVAFVASRAEQRGLRALAAGVTGAAVLYTSSRHVDIGTAFGSPTQVDPVFLGALAVWALVYLGALVEDALRRAAAVSWDVVLTASLATLGFLAAALLATGSDTPTLRALLTAAAGIADLTVGAVLLRARPAGRDAVALLLGQSLGLFAAAIAFGLSGATITVLWAALAAVAAASAARTRDGIWLGVAALLFIATLARLLGVDVAQTEAIVERFFESSGRAGALTVPLLFNPRAYALAGVGASFLVSARLLARVDPWRGGAALAAVLGWGLLLALALTETRSAAFHAPAAPPVPLDAAEWTAWSAHYDAAVAAQRGPLSMIATLVMALFAALLLGGGFAARHAFHRWLGLSLFLVTVAKLALWDVWNIERIYQIVLLTGVGALLVAGGFLYARFGRRLVALMREGAPDPRPPTGARAGASALIFLALSAASARAEAEAARPLPVKSLASARSIEGVDAAGDFTFPIDPDLYRAGKAASLLGDLRIADPDGLEVPYVVRELGSLRNPESHVEIYASLLDPSFSSGGDVHATFHLSPRAEHCRVDLDLEGSVFLRQVRVETGEDPDALGVVAEGPWVYRVDQQGSPLEHLSVPYPRSEASRVKITLLAGDSSTSVRIRGGRFSCLTERELALDHPVDRIPLLVEETTHDAALKTTVLTLDAGAEGAPLVAVDLDLGTPELSRRVEVTATSYRAVWPEIGRGGIYRVRGAGGALLESTRLPVAETRKRWLRVTIHDDDSAPLAIRGASGEIRRRDLVFRSTRGGPHTLYTGDSAAAAPRYDLGEILSRRGDIAESSVKLGPLGPNPRFGVEEISPVLPVTERYRTPIGLALAVLLALLSLWAVRLLRAKDPEPPAPPPPAV